MIANAAFPMQSWLTDGLLIYRCFVIYSSNFWVVFFPLLLLLGYISSSIAVLIRLNGPDKGLWSGLNKDLATSFCSLSITLNVIVTSLIIMRLFWYRKTIVNALGPFHGTYCISLSAIMVESAILNTICSLVFLIPYAIGNPVSNVFQGLSGIFSDYCVHAHCAPRCTRSGLVKYYGTDRSTKHCASHAAGW